MRKKIFQHIKGNIPVQFFKEGEMFIAYSSAIDLSTCGETFDEANDNFLEAFKAYMAECILRGTLDKALESYGWKKTKKEWRRRDRVYARAH